MPNASTNKLGDVFQGHASMSRDFVSLVLKTTQDYEAIKLFLGEILQESVVTETRRSFNHADEIFENWTGNLFDRTAKNYYNPKLDY